MDKTKLASVSGVYKTYSQADKASLKELQEETQKRLNLPEAISLGDMMAAVEPGMKTPAHLKAA